MTLDEEVDRHSKDRIAALTDGIYSVAMTLLVIDLKLPEGVELRDSHDLAQALIALEPKFTTWVTSFFVLVLFYLATCAAGQAAFLLMLLVHPLSLRAAGKR